MTTFLEKPVDTRLKVQTLVEQLVNQVEEGHLDPLQLMIELKGLEEVIKAVRERIRDMSINELYKHGKFTILNGNKLQVNSGRRIFSYDHYDKWVIKQNQLKKIEEEMKMAINHTIVDEETGEVIPSAKVKHTTETVSVTLS